MSKLLVLGSAIAAAWAVMRHRPREVCNVEQRCADIDRYAAAARRRG